ncbi:hypothetical protein SAY87_021074 [Trapa incisa]|uniref:Uncharacterized protein n=2 Tax=Trapa TaxID=22665 RepID=A0AAN7M5U5_TRANT|nr:hypothetical protein SAY87_021074 [Trapa incisa]KAK4803443.1 hypothetical protein SAY86_003260 [Trapa natans]
MIACCFTFPSKKSKKNTRSGAEAGASRLASSEDGGWGRNEGLLTDLSTFSVEEQERRLKKAKEVEELARLNAEMVDRVVRQESMRMVD